MKLRIGTRGSDLALWQARHVASRLEAVGFEIEIVVLKTRGDRIDDVPLHKVEGKAFFTAEIETALLEKRVDLAVHSHKDLPVESPAGLAIVAVPERADAGEVLLLARPAHAPDASFLPIVSGARVGTSAPRRTEQLQTLRPDLVVESLRGNVPTRVRKLQEGQYDAIVLAAAGIDRLGLDLGELVRVPLPRAWFVPSPSQGALAIQARSPEEAWVPRVRAALHDATTAEAIAAERELLARAGGGCSLPLGCGVERVGDTWQAHAFLGCDHPRPGIGARWSTGTGTTPRAAVDAAAGPLLEGGATGAGPLASLRVAIAGSAANGTRIGRRLEALGAKVLHEAVLAHEDVDADLAGALERLRMGDALIVTSKQAARRLAGSRVPAGVLVAAVGPATAAALAQAGLTAEITGTAGARALAESLPLAAGSRVLFPCAAEPLDELENALTARGVTVERLVLYRTTARPAAQLASGVDARVLMSPSAVAAVAALGDDGALRVALGETTAQALAARGLDHRTPAGTGAEAVAALLHQISPEGALR
jgi:hydroxymethylbilane synthase